MESKADSIFANRQTIEKYDVELWQALDKESMRQEEHIELIASENYASKRVMEAQGGLLTNKYAEGYPNKRYYGGCEYVDVAEEIAISRAKELFKADYANVQPHSGSSANAAAFLAMLEPNDLTDLIPIISSHIVLLLQVIVAEIKLKPYARLQNRISI